MKKHYLSLPLLTMLSLSTVAHADDISLCDQYGATPADPLLPANVKATNYHTISKEALPAIVQACQHAYDSSKNPRYLFQLGNVSTSYITERTFERYASGINDEFYTINLRGRGIEKLIEHGIEKNTRTAYQTAAAQGYHPARYMLLLMDSLHPDSSSEPWEAFMQEKSGLAHMGLAQWHGMKESDQEGTSDLHWREMLKHIQAVMADEHPPAWDALTLELIYRNKNHINDMGAEKIMREIAAKPHTPQTSALLAGIFYQSGNYPEADRFAAEIDSSASPISPDQEIEYHYLRGLRWLNGWGMDKNEDKAIADLQIAARQGHPLAQQTLISLKKTW
ncbi:MAG: hypothetical protein Q4A74_05500 [Cardiobacteriaceae bacterium]|nr:hypothetical protein [Cardiobacteriaceae bacterium]